MTALSFDLPDAVIEQIAQRAAELVAERSGQVEDDGWLSVAEAADYLRCSSPRIYQLVSAKRIPYHKDGSRDLFRRSELDGWVRAGGARCP